jgi:hypothetical protein
MSRCGDELISLLDCQLAQLQPWRHCSPWHTGEVVISQLETEKLTKLFLSILQVAKNKRSPRGPCRAHQSAHPQHITCIADSGAWCCHSPLKFNPTDYPNDHISTYSNILKRSLARTLSILVTSGVLGI